MIDKITIELDDAGFFLINLGDVHHITAHKSSEVAYIINKYCKSLAHFPHNLPCANPRKVLKAEYLKVLHSQLQEARQKVEYYINSEEIMLTDVTE